MKIKTILASGAAASTLIASSAFAGGMDRATFSPSILFEQGNYAEAALAVTLPSVTPAGLPHSFNVAESFTTLKFGYKHQFNDKLAVAFVYNNQPLGVDINYASLGSPLRGSVSSTSATLLAKYSFTDRFSAFAGIKHQIAKGSADLTAIPALGLTEAHSFSSDSDTGYIAGVAYEIPDIALRVSLSYESKLDFELDSIGATSGGNYGKTLAGSPEAYTLEFQSGIAADTLLFGSVRRANWSDANVVFAGLAPLSNFEDTTAYSLGIGRKISDEFSMSLTLSYEDKGAEPVSSLAPTNGLFGVALGGAYTGANGVKTSMGISYSPRGDAMTDAGTQFGDNEVITFGMKVSKSF
ncbi:membrane protein [Amylibacter ulvae]|uniref:Membrane protein n=1 Tax=Paramylibacter ulvae TaxID=1651968 RepID=A0ABQ3CRW4_9RHOB|nr:hypothetical protein [Amylibacter ulvae]GHA41170.1 membrane protein [Amylibacter ulvae]